MTLWEILHNNNHMKHTILFTVMAVAALIGSLAIMPKVSDVDVVSSEVAFSDTCNALRRGLLPNGITHEDAAHYSKFCN